MARLVSHRGHRARLGRRHQRKTFRHLRDFVAVAHPHLQHAVAFRRAEILDAFEQARMVARAHLGIAEFAHVTQLDFAAQLLGHRLHAIANAEHRHAQFEHRLRCARRIVFRDRTRPAGQDDALRGEFADERVVDIVRMDFRIDVRFANTARNQLGNLRTHVEDQNLVMHGGHGSIVDEYERSANRAAHKRSNGQTPSAAQPQRAQK